MRPGRLQRLESATKLVDVRAPPREELAAEAGVEPAPTDDVRHECVAREESATRQRDGKGNRVPLGATSEKLAPPSHFWFSRGRVNFHAYPGTSSQTETAMDAIGTEQTSVTARGHIAGIATAIPA